MTSKNWVLGRLKNIIGPAASSIGQADGFPAAQPLAGYYYADDGNFYEDPQTAIDNANHYVSLGCENIEANLTITTGDFTLECKSGAGIVDGTDQGPAITVDAPNVNLEGMEVRTDADSGNSAIVVTENGDETDIIDVTVTESGDHGIEGHPDASEVEVDDSRVESAANRAVFLQGEQCRITSTYALAGVDDGITITGDDSEATSNYVVDVGNDGVDVAGDGSVANINTVLGAGDNGMTISGNDCTANSNVVKNSGDDGIRLSGTDDVAVGNRIGGSTNTDLDTSAATTPTTGNNNTGPLN